MNIKSLLKRPESIFVASTLISSGLNFLYNAYLGRALSYEDFGILSLFNAFLYVAGIFLNALGGTINHRIAYLNANLGELAGFGFFQNTVKKVFAISGVLTLIWILASPYLATYFHLSSVFPLLFFTPVLTLGMFYAAQKGLLQGLFYFQRSGLVFLAEASAKLILAVLIINLGFRASVYLSIPGSILVGFIAATFLSLSYIFKKGDKKKHAFGKRFYTASLFNGFAATAFLSFDLILIKHFLSPFEAGEYAVLSLVGKMIYFLGSIPNAFMISYISNADGKGKNALSVFYKLYGVVCAVVLAAFMLLGPFGVIIVPILLGAKTASILPYLTLYCLGIAMFTLATTIVSFHLSRRQYVFSGIATCASIILSLSIVIWHRDIKEVVGVVSNVSFIYLLVVVLFHLFSRNGYFILRNIIDLYDAFRPLPPVKRIKGKKRILIFNWRDTKHLYAGGAEVYIHELAKRWVKDGNSVTNFCGNDGRNLRYEIVDGVEVYRRGGFYFVYFWAFLYYFTQFRGRFDIIIDSQNGIPFFTPLYVKEKVFCLMHHVHQEVFRKSLKFPLREIASTLENSLMPWTYRHTRFITVSESTKHDMIVLGLTGSGIDIVPPGVDLTKYKPGTKNRKPSVLYVGRLKHYKRVNIFLRLVKEIHSRLPETEFVIAGDGEKRKSLQAYAKKLGIQRVVKFLGKVDEKTKIALYQKAWVMVNPSMMEGFGITSIEANACATPVVASDVPGLRDSVSDKNSGCLASYLSVDDFIRKTEDILQSADVRKKFEQKSLSWAKKFSWDAQAKKSINIIYE